MGNVLEICYRYMHLRIFLTLGCETWYRMILKPFIIILLFWQGATDQVKCPITSYQDCKYQLCTYPFVHIFIFNNYRTMENIYWCKILWNCLLTLYFNSTWLLHMETTPTSTHGNRTRNCSYRSRVYFYCRARSNGQRHYRHVWTAIVNEELRRAMIMVLLILLLSLGWFIQQWPTWIRKRGQTISPTVVESSC